MLEDDVAALIARCALGDRAALTRLYALRAARLFGVASAILQNSSDAEEALQEAFIKIWYSAGQYRAGRGSADGWLIAIVRNKAIDIRRSRVARRFQTMEGLQLTDHGPGPELSALQAEERRRIRACIDLLPENRAKAIRGAYLEGLTYAELASRFSIPLNTMRTWLRRALITLRNCLEQDI